jgi:hypothetical protein
MMSTREQQIHQIQGHIREWREGAAESTRRANEHLAEAARASEMADRWASVLDAVHFGRIHGLDVPPTTGTEDVEVPW